MQSPIALRVQLPSWIEGVVDWTAAWASDEARMELAVALARENIERQTGGPFGAAVFERASGRLVSVGVNLVATEQNAVLHAEVVALMLACSVVGSYRLSSEGVEHELVTSCDPCAMCLGATLWSGVSRVVTGASREDARRVGFEEGPVFDASWRYLEARQVEVVRGVLRERARGVLEEYRERGGEIYNG